MPFLFKNQRFNYACVTRDSIRMKVKWSIAGSHTQLVSLQPMTLSQNDKHYNFALFMRVSMFWFTCLWSLIIILCYLLLIVKNIRPLSSLIPLFTLKSRISTSYYLIQVSREDLSYQLTKFQKTTIVVHKFDTGYTCWVVARDLCQMIPIRFYRFFLLRIPLLKRD